MGEAGKIHSYKVIRVDYFAEAVKIIKNKYPDSYRFLVDHLDYTPKPWTAKFYEQVTQVLVYSKPTVITKSKYIVEKKMMPFDPN